MSEKRELKTASEVIDELGGTTRTAELLGVLPSAVSNYRKTGFSRPVRFDIARLCADRGLKVADSAYQQTEHA